MELSGVPQAMEALRWALSEQLPQGQLQYNVIRKSPKEAFLVKSQGALQRTKNKTDPYTEELPIENI